MEGDDRKTLSYETLIEQEKFRATWRKIKFHLNRGNTEPLTRLLINEAQGGPGQIITDGSTIQEKIIQHNIEHFSKAEHTPLGKGTFLHDAIGPHGTSEFYD